VLLRQPNLLKNKKVQDSVFIVLRVLYNFGFTAVSKIHPLTYS
jgi:hypothetical protein